MDDEKSSQIDEKVSIEGPISTESLEEDGSEKTVPENKTFSSENFKIEIKGIPRFCSASQIKKLLNNNLKLNGHKFKPPGINKDWIFVCFRNEDDRERAISTLNGYVFKNKTLKAFKSTAKQDPFKKINETRNQTNNTDNEQSNLSVFDRIQAAVAPLFTKTYDEQLKIKHKNTLKVFDKLKGQLMKENKALKWLFLERPIDIRHVVKSPEINNYRNKCEFTVGLHPETREPVVGFRLSSYKKGSISVAPIDGLPQIPEAMGNIVRIFQEYVRKSCHKPYDNTDRSGFWRQLTVRTNQRGESLVLVILHPQHMLDETRENLRSELRNLFVKDREVGIKSLNIQFQPQKEQGVEAPVELLFGEDSITETLFGITFRISANAFFQVNTKAAEVLYRTIGDVAGLTPESTLLDVCCGTGTIGLCLASRCRHVFGVEVVPSAVEDARNNASANGISNSTFVEGRAEKVMYRLFSQVESNDLVAVVDPPRAGLHNKALAAIRNDERIRKLVYVSCDAKAASKNFVDLCRPPSNMYNSEPFIPTVVIPVDLFPHTYHLELIIIFERTSMQEILLYKEKSCKI